MGKPRNLRFSLKGFKKVISDACVYHFVSKSTRTSTDSQHIEYNSNKNFIRKWGSITSDVKYNIGFVIKNCNSNILEALEPWCSRIYIDDNMQVLTTHYINKEQPNTKFDLSKRIYTIEYNDPKLENDIVVEFDVKQFTQQSFDIIQKLPEIIKESGEVGTFELDIFTININSMAEYQNDLIYLKSN